MSKKPRTPQEEASEQENFLKTIERSTQLEYLITLFSSLQFQMGSKNTIF